MAQRPTIETTYGTVDRFVLEELRQTLDTNEILTAIEVVDRSVANPDERGRLHAGLRCLHGMARHLIDTAPATIVSEQPIWQLAEEILDDLDASGVELTGIAAIVDRIASLRPNDE